MASLRQIRRRMKSIENIHEITKAMEMIAAFRFKKAEGRFSRSRAYFAEMEKIISNLSSARLAGARLPDGQGQGSTEAEHPLFTKRNVKKKALVVMAGDKGLCGAYNANLLRAASGWLAQNAGVDASVIPVGKMAYEFFRKRQKSFVLSYPERALVDLTLATRITTDIKNSFLKGQVDSVELLYTTFRVGAPGRNKVAPFLSLNYLVEKNRAAQAVDYIYEPGFEAVFISLLEKYLEGKMVMTLLESLTSEFAARRIAMKQATENGEEVLDDLKLLRNKTRQAVITRELSEIVSGASVLV